MTGTLIIGGGLAGLSAAVTLASRGVRCEIIEARSRLGGRAGSFSDPETGQLIDACQHVSMGCCTAFKAFTQTLGIWHFFEKQERLYFMTPDRRVSIFRRDPWPAPFHLGRALASAHYLSGVEKAEIACGLARLALMPADHDEPLLAWLQAHSQSPRGIRRFWDVVLTSALNESVENLGTKYARKVFVDAFLKDRDGFVVELPTVPLGRLYGEELHRWLARHSVAIHEGVGVATVQPGTPMRVILRDGRVLEASRVILAVPFARVLDLLPESVASQPFFARISRLTPSPITSVHLWYDRDVLKLPHVVLLDSLGQWVFRRSGGYLQVVVSASGELKSLGREEIEKRITKELRILFPKLRDTTLQRTKVVTEHAATFRAVPGVDALRPPQSTPIPGLLLAGDWTATGWPATMEGAVRSGVLAADAMTSKIR